MARYIVGVHSKSDFGPDLAIVDLIPEQAAWLAGLVRKVRELSESDEYSRLYCMELWDNSASYVSAGGFDCLLESGADEEQLDMLLSCDIDCYRCDELKDMPDEEYARTECGTVCATKDGVHWTAYVKHTDVQIETRSLSLNELDEAAGDAADG